MESAINMCLLPQGSQEMGRKVHTHLRQTTNLKRQEFRSHTLRESPSQDFVKNLWYSIANEDGKIPVRFVRRSGESTVHPSRKSAVERIETEPEDLEIATMPLLQGQTSKTPRTAHR